MANTDSAWYRVWVIRTLVMAWEATGVDALYAVMDITVPDCKAAVFVTKGRLVVNKAIKRYYVCSPR